MKKIFIVSDSLRIGGIQKSLINLLNNIDYSNYEVDLLLFDDSKFSYLNPHINKVKTNSLLRIIGTPAMELKKRNYLHYIIRRLLSLLCIIFSSKFVFSIIYFFSQKKNKYDYAISYSNNLNNRSLYYGYNKYVIENINAEKKISWVHIDYINRKREKWELEEYNKFDSIIFVSNACERNFINIYPELKGKTYIVYNYLSTQDIKEQAEEFLPKYNKNCFNIVSIGRVEKNKNFEMQVDIAKVLKEKGYIFKINIIGNGIDYQYIKNKIVECDLCDYVELLGEKENVYPYIKSSDLLLSTSLSESFGLTIAEALVLNTPVVALNYPALCEIISDNGIICNSKEEIIDSISTLIENDKEYKRLKGKSVYKISEKNVKSQFFNALEGVKNDKN